MKRIRAVVLAVLVLAMTGQVQAGVFEHDWKVPGDGLLTYDDVNQREWLDVTESLLLNFDVSPFNNAYSNIVAETMPGGVFEGFHVAGSADVIALGQSAGIDTTTLDFDRNGAAAGEVIDLLGPTFGSPISGGSLSAFVVGYLEMPQETAFFQYRAVSRRAGLLVGLGAGGDIIRPANAGVMLFRAAVPEPATCLLLVPAIVIVLLVADRRIRT